MRTAKPEGEMRRELKGRIPRVIENDSWYAFRESLVSSTSGCSQHLRPLVLERCAETEFGEAKSVSGFPQKHRDKTKI